MNKSWEEIAGRFLELVNVKRALDDLKDTQNYQNSIINIEIATLEKSGTNHNKVKIQLTGSNNAHLIKVLKKHLVEEEKQLKIDLEGVGLDLPI